MTRTGALAIGIAVLTGSGTAALSPEDRCQTAQHKAAAKYAACRHKAEAKAVKKGIAPVLAACDTKLAKLWSRLRAKAEKTGATCRYDRDESEIGAVVAADVARRVVAFDGSGFPRCGDGVVNVAGEQCDGSDLADLDCSTLGLGGGAIACTLDCRLNTGPCTPACPPGSIACGGTCVSLLSDNLHCGTCGAACTAGTRCELGACVSTAL